MLDKHLVDRRKTSNKNNHNEHDHRQSLKSMPETPLLLIRKNTLPL